MQKSPDFFSAENHHFTLNFTSLLYGVNAGQLWVPSLARHPPRERGGHPAGPAAACAVHRRRGATTPPQSRPCPVCRPHGPPGRRRRPRRAPGASPRELRGRRRVAPGAPPGSPRRPSIAPPAAPSASTATRPAPASAAPDPSPLRRWRGATAATPQQPPRPPRGTACACARSGAPGRAGTW